MSGEKRAPENAILEIRRGDLGKTRIVTEELADPAPGEVQMRVERFALTANNVTYGVIGDMLGYWDFFPAADPDAGWGRIPAMGWAEVIASEVDGIEPGGRYYGWYPMARYCTFTATPTRDGIRDDSPHRAEHAPVYRAYLRTEDDALYAEGEDAEDRHALLRGLFATAALADDFFADASYFGADAVVVLSASSKTAIGYAHRAAERGIDRIIGITSAGNREFVKDLGLYTDVLSYGEESELPDEDSVLIDMAGNGEVLKRVHAELGDRLKHSMIVGMSHHDAERGPVSAGPEPQMFFAPGHVKKRSEELGREDFQRWLADATQALIGASGRWLDIERSNGPEEAAGAYAAIYDGSTPPSVGRIVSLH